MSHYHTGLPALCLLSELGHWEPMGAMGATGSHWEPLGANGSHWEPLAGQKAEEGRIFPHSLHALGSGLGEQVLSTLSSVPTRNQSSSPWFQFSLF